LAYWLAAEPVGAAETESSVSTAIIPIECEAIKLGEPHGVQLTKTGLTFSRAISIDEWADFGQQLKKIEGTLQWWIGDWLNYGEKTYGENYTEALAITGYDYQYLRDMKYVSQAVELSLRNDNLSWTHHRAVAALEPEQQAEMLTRAHTNNLSVRELRDMVKRFNPEPSKLPKTSTVPTLDHEALATRLRIVSATITEYYASPLADLHPHGRYCGGLNGHGIVYAAEDGNKDTVGLLLLRQNQNGQCIVRLLAQDWDARIGQTLLKHALKHHTNVYALCDDLDLKEYLAMYTGRMHEVSREFVPASELFSDLPDTFDWAEQSCIDYLTEHPDIHQRLIENSKALGIRMRPSGNPLSPEQIQEKLEDVEQAGKKLSLLRPRTVMRYEPIETAEPRMNIESVEEIDETTASSRIDELDTEPEPPKSPEFIAARQAHEKAAGELKSLLKTNGIDADVTRSKTDGKFHVVWHDVTTEQVHEFAGRFKA
jgi:hypothetical protein